MMPLTPRERQALIILAGLLVAGCFLKLLFCVQPAAVHWHVLDDVSYRPRVPVNRASYDELLAVPHLGPSTAGKIVRFRQHEGLIHGAEDLARALGRRSRQVQDIAPFLSFEAP